MAPQGAKMAQVFGAFMSGDEAIARLRTALKGKRSITEKKMFGGICFLLRGHMLCAGSKRGFMFRVGDAQEPDALARAGTRRMEMNGREYPGYVRADPARCKGSDVRALVAMALNHVGKLPANKPRAARKKKPRKVKRSR